jgi:hypothetical protein
MSFSDTSPKLNDSDNTLLSKICQVLDSGGTGTSFVLRAGDTMTGTLNVGTPGVSTFDYQFISSGGAHFSRKTADPNPPVLDFDKRGNTGDANASVVSGSLCGQILFSGWDGSAFGEAATIISGANEVFSGTAHGGNIQFSTTTPTTTTRVERVRIDSVALNLKACALQLNSVAYFNPLTVYAAGTVYTLTATNAAVTFGTTSPIVTVSAAGTYAVRARIKVSLNGATFAATRTLTVKLRRTNNTATDLANSSTTYIVPILATLTNTLAIIELPEVLYTTALTNDTIQLFSDISVLPSAGTISIDEASIVAVRLS